MESTTAKSNPEAGVPTGGAMCCSKRLSAALHLVFSFLYVAIGGVQLIAGIYFLFVLPMFHVGSNIWTGAWDLFSGITGMLLICFGELTEVKQQGLLVLTMAVLTINTANMVVLEVGEWRYFLTDEKIAYMKEKRLEDVQHCAHLVTGISTLVALVASFLDSQFTFCAMQRRREKRPVTEQVSDIEYIIPKKPGSENSGERQTSAPVTLSWVFNADSGISITKATVNEKQMVQTEASDASSILPKSQSLPLPEVTIVTDDSPPNTNERKLKHMESFTLKMHDRPLVVTRQRSRSLTDEIEVSTYFPPTEEEEGNSDEVDHHQTAPVSWTGVLTLQDEEDAGGDESTRISLNTELEDMKPQYACVMDELRKHMPPKVSGTPSAGEESGSQSSNASPVHDSTLTRNEDVNVSPSSKTIVSPTESSINDAVFSEELEAALKALRNVGSGMSSSSSSVNDANTKIEKGHSLARPPKLKRLRPTPPKRSQSTTLHDHTQRKNNRTLIFKTPATSEDSSPVKLDVAGTSAGDVRHSTNLSSHVRTGSDDSSESLSSSSGYSSPSGATSKAPSRISSKQSSLDGSLNNIPASGSNSTMPNESLNCTIHNKGSVTVISLTPSTKSSQNVELDALSNRKGNPQHQRALSWTPPHAPSSILVQRGAQTLSRRFGSKKSGKSRVYLAPDQEASDEYEDNEAPSTPPLWQLRSLVNRNKSISPDIQEAIVHSESLAYLSELELLARHCKTKAVHRQLEQKAYQQVAGNPVDDSYC